MQLIVFCVSITIYSCKFVGDIEIYSRAESLICLDYSQAGEARWPHG